VKKTCGIDYTLTEDIWQFDNGTFHEGNGNNAVNKMAFTIVLAYMGKIYPACMVSLVSTRKMPPLCSGGIEE
jgi:hypothetical protein